MSLLWPQSASSVTRATSIHRQALIRSNEIETLRPVSERAWGCSGDVSGYREGHLSGPSCVRLCRSLLPLSVRLCICVCLFVCACAVAATGCSIGRKGDEAVWQLRTDNDEDYNDDVIGPLVVAGFWWQSVWKVKWNSSSIKERECTQYENCAAVGGSWHLVICYS